MTRKDYVLLARALRETRQYMAAKLAANGGEPYDYGVEAGIAEAQERICNALAADNPAFDRARFIAACRTEAQS